MAAGIFPPPIGVSQPAYTPSAGTASSGGTTRFAVGNPSSRPRWSPTTTTPLNLKSRPRCREANRTSPQSKASRMRVEHVVRASTPDSSSVRTSKRPAASSLRVPTSPDARCPKRKFSPTTTVRGASGTTKRSTNSAGLMAATFLSKRTTLTSRAPACLSRSIRVGRSLNRRGACSGASTDNGWGQKVMTASSPSPRSACSTR